MTKEEARKPLPTTKRKFHLKSKNGCLTCKRRRIKCDETKPACNKCQNMNLECGYVIDTKQQLQGSQELQELQLAELLLDLLQQHHRVAPQPLITPPSPPDQLLGAELPQKKRKVSDSALAPPARRTSLETSYQSPSATPLTHSQSSSIHLGSIPLQLQDLQAPGVAESVGMAAAASSSSIAGSIAASIDAQGNSNTSTNGAAPSLPPKPFDPSKFNAGNLNNINLSQLVNNLSGLGDLSSLGNLANLSSLASLAQLPIDLSNISSLLEGDISGLGHKFKQFQQMQMQMQLQLPKHSQLQIPTEIPTGIPSGIPSLLHDFPMMPSAAADLPQELPSEVEASAHGGSMHQQPLSAHELPPNVPRISPNIPGSTLPTFPDSSLNMLDLRLMFHYTSQVSTTITGAGISDTNIWTYDIPMLAFNYPFLMHSILAFSATHLSRTEKGLDQCVTSHRGDALRLLREAVLNINSDNTDALVASALILIMDSLANASFPSSTSPKSLPASAWIFHVKGAATILTAVWPLTESSRFYKFISVDLSDLGDIMNRKVDLKANSTSKNYADLECHDSDIADLFPVEVVLPYLITLAYLNKLHKERYKSDFILRIFAFPALLDKTFLSLLMTGDIKAMRIMRSYYKLLRSFTTEMKDKVWFLEGVLNVLPVDVEEYAGGAGGMHMMLDFLGGGPSIIENEVDEEMIKFDPTGTLTKGLTDPNNLPSDITSNLDIMGDSGFIGQEP